MVVEKSHIYSVKITANTCVNWICSFYLCLQATLSPGFLSLSPGRWELPIPHKQHFLKIFFPEEKEGQEDYGVEKITKINKGNGHKF